MSRIRLFKAAKHLSFEICWSAHVEMMVLQIKLYEYTL